ncbi:MAG: PTS sugar transporter subunit IIA [Thermoanaerobaculia bacterium]
MKISEMLDPSLILLPLKGNTKEEVFKELEEHLEKNKYIKKNEPIAELLHKREDLGSTAVGKGVAIPHCKSENLKDTLLAIGIKKEGIYFPSPDGELVKILFFVLSPPGKTIDHLQLLSKISKLIRIPGVIQNLQAATSPQNFLEILKKEEKKL